MFTVFIGTAAQTLLVVIPLYLILHEYTSLWISLGLFAICAWILKRFWWNHLDDQL